MRRAGESAILALCNGTYTNMRGHKDAYGMFQDEVVPFGDWSAWFYHGNMIAAYNRETGECLLTDCGWDTQTTRARLYSVSFVLRNHNRWKRGNRDDEARMLEVFGPLAGDQYMHTDAWRGYGVHPFAVFGSSNTGNWSDSPCPSDCVEKECKDVVSYLKGKGFRPYVLYKETSNIFCIKNYVAVRGKEYKEAKEAMQEYTGSIVYGHIA